MINGDATTVDKATELQKRREKAVPRGPYNVTQIYVESAEGALIKDVNGKEYIDFAGGIGIQNIGHNHPKVVEAIQNQVSKFIHTCFHVAPYESYIELAEKLNALTPGNFEKKTMFVNSGSEAVENAIKIARKYTGKPGVVSFDRGYHGRTLLTLSLTSKVVPYKKGFGPFATDTYRMPYPYYYRSEDSLTNDQVDDQILEKFKDFFLSEASPEDIGAVIIEPVQGEGGFVVPSARFVQGLKKICEENNILFIADEIQTGFCRTGKMFAIEHFGVEPDLMTMSKSLAAGMPLSAVTGRAEVMNAPDIGQLGGTFAGSPVSCAASLAVLDVIEEEKLVERSAWLGEKIQAKFNEFQQKFKEVGEVRGLGPMCAFELVKDRETKTPDKELTAAIVQESWKQGLISLSAGIYGNVLRFLPPVTITEEQLEKGFSILEQVIAQEIAKKQG
ncbi:4-aminobutyrate aminotransferase/(S)-3-amino-2-methylpropionate transaminase [Bacillus ectoiniformans]|uniref:4-aminobutyrate--2-oxoglutarate transaminase n=1 Tax=Bacillus ectoiniformans TaxID=1494429 RepID=UPI001EF9235A|nr:4-aminobutyrate--2-oxoglutarate transaminase [Bacillus ectoiniformans]MBM7649864.1 4-aminobutyrate aminotransferase/(S)-3-amino-2-methylpropionate transaminase [Bacillus ectoiniformans]